MKSNAEVVYRDLKASSTLNDTINKRLAKLSRFSDAIIHSRVVLDSPNKSKHKGKIFRASIEIDVKGAPLLVSNDDSSMHVAVRDAFATMERKLKEDSKRKHFKH